MWYRIDSEDIFFCFHGLQYKWTAIVEVDILVGAVIVANFDMVELDA